MNIISKFERAGYRHLLYHVLSFNLKFFPNLSPTISSTVRDCPQTKAQQWMD